jgi:hypothetical protein
MSESDARESFTTGSNPIWATARASDPEGRRLELDSHCASFTTAGNPIGTIVVLLKLLSLD